MKIGRKLSIVLCLVGLSVTGCSSAERNQKYFAAHLDEAREVVLKCSNSSKADAECSAAGDALRAEGIRAHRQNFGNVEDVPAYGNGY